MYTRHDDQLFLQPAVAVPDPDPGWRRRFDLRRAFSAWAARRAEARARRRGAAAMARLDRHMLRDIGALGRDLARLAREGRD